MTEETRGSAANVTTLRAKGARSASAKTPSLLTRIAGLANSAWTALLVYVVLSVVLFGRGFLSDPSGHCVCLGPAGDPPAYMWALSWWPHAIAHGLNPFQSAEVWAPGGIDTAGYALVPGAALAMFPVTELFGPLVSYNVLALLSPALSAFTAFGLCRYITGRTAASFAGGLIFGFSSYELGHLLGHANLFTIFLIPLFPYLVVRRVAGEVSRALFVVGVAALFIGQLLLSTELTFDVVIMGVLSFAVAYRLADPRDRLRLRGVIPECLIGGVIAAALLSPYLWWATVKANPAQTLGDVSVDPLNLLIPSRVTLLGGSAATQISNSYGSGFLAEAGGYLGLPLLLAIAAFAITRWRMRSTRLVATVAAIAFIISLGSHLIVHGQSLIPLPWRAVSPTLPLFKTVIPARFILFADLALAVGIALWLSTVRTWLPWLIVVVALLATFPAINGNLWVSTPSQPEFITHHTAEKVIPANAIVLTLPFGQYGYGQLWQAEDGFTFRLAATYFGVTPQEYVSERVVNQMVIRDGPPSLSLFQEPNTHHVSRIILDASAPHRWPEFLAAMGLKPRAVGGILLYTVPEPLRS